MGVWEFLQDKGPCLGGQLIYEAAKKSTRIINSLPFRRRKLKSLTSKTINCLKNLYNHADLTKVRYKIKCSMPGNWFTRSNNFDAITFGNMIYFKGRDIQKSEEGLELLMHELVHVDQVAKFGSQSKFACEYGKGFVQGGDYRSNPLEDEAYNFTAANAVPTGCIQPRARVVWWHGKDYQGERHTRYLYASDHNRKINLVHNDDMKSLKFYAHPGWKLFIYDKKNCGTNDDWGKITFPNNPNLDCVKLPRIGKQGENKVDPPNCYDFHYKNGLPGKVSSMKLKTS